MSNTKKQLLKLFIEIFPIVVFFYTYDSAHRESIYLATKAFMASMAVSLILSKLIFKKIGLILWISGGLVGVMGSATLYFQNDLFIKLKPTILYSFFALSLLGGMGYKKYFLKNIFGASFPPLPDEVWRKLTWRFGIFYIFNAILNEVIHRNFSLETWIATKLWLFMPLSILFMLAQTPLLMKYIDKEEES